MVAGPKTPKRILFVAESVTLAHFARPVALAQGLDPATYDIHLASDPRYLGLAPDPLPFAFHPIHTIPSAQFTAALARGSPVYDAGTLASYVEEDLDLLNEVRPDLVVGDFRLSLAMSAPLAGVPYAAIVNAYWSPYARVRYPVPDLPFARILGIGIAQRVFDVVRPLAFALHARPLNRVRRQFGLPSLGNDLRRVYSWGDYVLYPDLPDAVDMAPLPPNHRFIGPILWSARVDPPDWWDALPTDGPVVYVTLGTSGRADLLPIVLDALGDLPVTVIAARAGSAEVRRPPSNAYLADYLPGDAATARSQLVICNGGSLTTYQALHAGVPIIGITTNMDQLLSMGAVCRSGAGATQRAEKLTVDGCREMATKLLREPRHREAARSAGYAFDAAGSLNNFRAFLADNR